ncbi:hypothetical protein BCAR13_440111 [Paraburkholderia caribensis]|nr:hypothetical protein BCAR13_440111 [Paraburkholderia caribensis]
MPIPNTARSKPQRPPYSTNAHNADYTARCRIPRGLAAGDATREYLSAIQDGSLRPSRLRKARIPDPILVLRQPKRSEAYSAKPGRPFPLCFNIATFRFWEK